MKKLKKFSEFINETEPAEFKLPNPASGGSDLGKIIVQNKDGKEVGSNSGTFVNKVQRSVGITDGQPWCMAFVFYIFDQFSTKMGVKNPVYKTGSALDEWAKTTGKKITVDEAKSNFSLVKPGQIFVATREGGGHTGIVTSVDYNGKKFTTVEGNVRIDANRNQGVGGYNRSLLTNGLLGFIDYFPNRTPEFDKSFTDAIKGKLKDTSGNTANRNLPGDEIIGGEEATSNADDTKQEKSNPGGLFGRIVSGAAKYMQMGKDPSSSSSGSDSISAKDTADALATVL